MPETHSIKILRNVGCIQEPFHNITNIKETYQRFSSDISIKYFFLILAIKLNVVRKESEIKHRLKEMRLYIVKND